MDKNTIHLSSKTRYEWNCCCTVQNIFHIYHEHTRHYWPLLAKARTHLGPMFAEEQHITWILPGIKLFHLKYIFGLVCTVLASVCVRPNYAFITLHAGRTAIHPTVARGIRTTFAAFVERF